MTWKSKILKNLSNISKRSQTQLIKTCFNDEIAASVNEVQTETEALQNEVRKASEQSKQQTTDLQSLEADILQLAKKLRVPKEQLNLPDTDQAESENAYVQKADIPYLTPKDFKHLNEMSKDDWIAASLIGVCAVLMDFMLVRTPRSISFTAINGTIVQKDGSALTDALCKIGFDADGKTSAWVKHNWSDTSK